MVNHTVQSFDKELSSLTDILFQMTELVSQILAACTQAWVSGNVENITKTKELDHQINILDYQIEQKAYNLIALRQPVGVDLRIIASSLKLSVTIERMGDLLKSTTKRACKFIQDIDDDLIKEFVIILQKLDIVFNTIKPLVKMEPEILTCTEVTQRVEEIQHIMKVLVGKIHIAIKENIELIEGYLNLLFAIKAMERFGECITKISRVHKYIQTGKKVLKHEISNMPEEI